jgi:hypothetical protein
MKRRREEQRVAKLSNIEKHLSSMAFCGVYFTNHDMDSIAKKLGFSYDMKSAKYILRTIFLDAEDNNKEKELLEEFIAIISRRAKELVNIGNLYESSRSILSIQLQRIKSTQMLLQKELSLVEYK